MSSVIKALDPSGSVRIQPLLGAAVPTLEEEEIARLKARIASIENELRQRDSKLAELRNEIPQAYENGRRDGEAAGLRAAEDRQLERLKLLETALRDANSVLVESLAGLERLAPLLAAECLDIILRDRKYRAAMVQKILSAQVKTLERSSVVSIELSKEDFDDPGALEKLKQEMALKQTVLEAKETIESGGCRIALRLGQMEVGIDQQWGSLRRELEAMSLPEVSR